MCRQSNKTVDKLALGAFKGIRGTVAFKGLRGHSLAHATWALYAFIERCASGCGFALHHDHPYSERVRLRAVAAANNSLKLCIASIEIAVRAADHFTRLYYKTYDSPTRVDDLPNFYRATSALTWNGTPYQGADGVRELISKMPTTMHEVQSFDCHPIPGASGRLVRLQRRSLYS